MPDKPSVSVHLLPSLIPPDALRGGVAVVTDVLRATTAMIHALAAGAEAIVPCLEVSEARAMAESMPGGRGVLAGERGGLPIEGFDLGNSPGSFDPATCGGRTVVMTTTNGTRAILASLDADRVLVAAFPNLGATFRALKDDPRPVQIVCAGTDGLVSFEDTLFAGALAGLLLDAGRPPGNDSALIARAALRGLWPGSATKDDDEGFAEVLAAGRGGRRVRQIGLGADLLDAARRDRFDFIAELRREPVRIVRPR